MTTRALWGFDHYGCELTAIRDQIIEVDKALLNLCKASGTLRVGEVTALDAAYCSGARASMLFYLRRAPVAEKLLTSLHVG